MSLHTGLNSLGRASHHDFGLYAQAFFSLQVGLERILKLIYVLDTAFAGASPSNHDLKKQFGHDLVALFTMASKVRTKLEDDGQSFRWDLVDAEATERIIKVLAEFGKVNRYYNLDYLIGSNPTSREPIAAWRKDVVDYLTKDYPLRRKVKDAALADTANEHYGQIMFIRMQPETGGSISDVHSEVMHLRKTAWAQGYATFHVAATVRYLAEILTVQTERCRQVGALGLPYLDEFFTVYNNKDDFLRGRKTFL